MRKFKQLFAGVLIGALVLSMCVFFTACDSAIEADESQYEVIYECTTYEKSSTGSYHVYTIMEIKNISDVPLKFNQCEIEYEDSTGKYLTSSSIYTASILLQTQIIMPGETAVLVGDTYIDKTFDTTKPLTTYVKVDARIADSEIIYLPISQFEITKQKYMGGYEISGRVGNNTSETTGKINIIVILRNDEGLPLWVVSTSISDVAAGDRKGFEGRANFRPPNAPFENIETIETYAFIIK